MTTPRAPVSPSSLLAFFVLTIVAACSDRLAEPTVSRADLESEPVGAPREAAPAARAAYIAAVQREHAAEHRLARTAEGFRGRAQGLRAEVGARGVVVSADRDDAGWRWEPSARRFGCEGALGDVEATPPEVEENRATYRRRAFDEWYVAGPLGIEQGFTLPAAPACRAGDAKRVVIDLGDGALEATVLPGAKGAALHDRRGHEVLRYSDLYVTDAAGRELPAEVRVRGERVAIAFDDAGAEYPVTVDPLIQQAKLTASDGASGDSFGESVAVSGDTAVVGARRAAYVFVRSAGVWTQQAKLAPSDGVSSDNRENFGGSVSVNGDTAVVGAEGRDSNRGAAYVFVRSAGAWTQQAKLTVSDSATSDFFGHSVSVSADTAVVGAYGKQQIGAAYAFVRSGGTWSQQAKLTSSDGASMDWFGSSVSVSGDTAVVGASGKDWSQGASYVFVRAGAAWTQQARLAASDGTSGDHFGESVSVSGDMIAVGAYGASDRGAAYVFTRSGATWAQGMKLTASDGASGDQLGYSVSVSGRTVLAGAPGKASAQGATYAFTRTKLVWLEQKLTASNAASNAYFGWSVSVSGSTSVAGALGNASTAGAAYVFASSNGTACSSGAECASGLCIDGLCCATACTGQCAACDVPGHEGTCSPVTGAPHGARTACATDGSACGGSCDGTKTTGCLYPTANCRNASCDGATNVATLEANCNGQGSCPAAQTVSCAPYVCGATACNGDCQKDADCAADHFCAGHVCAPKFANGVPCGGDPQCESGHCVDGVCCESGCHGQCEACRESGHEGACVTVSGAPRAGRPACAGAGACQGMCGGATATVCTFPDATTTCVAATCTNGTATPASSCDGQGTCKAGSQSSCGAYACGAEACKTSCAESSDCASGYGCVGGACVAASDAGADSGTEDAGADAETGVTEPAESTEGSSCGCQTVGARSGARFGVGIVMAALAVVAARRRRSLAQARPSTT